MHTDKKRVIHIRLRTDIPYEQRLQRALQDLPHGYIKRVVVQLFRSVVPETPTLMSEEQVRQTLIDVADKGIPSATSPQGRSYPVLPSTPDDDSDPPRGEASAKCRIASHEPRANALTGLISSGVS
jgi:hypothetical protein